MFISLQRSFDEPVADESDRQADDAGPKERWPQNFQCLPMKQLCQMQLLNAKFGRKSMRVVKNPESNLVFPPQNHRPNGQQDVVERHRNDRRNFAPAKYPGCENRQKRLQAGQRRETPEYPDCDATGNSMWGILQLMNVRPSHFESPLQINLQLH